MNFDILYYILLGVIRLKPACLLKFGAVFGFRPELDCWPQACVEQLLEISPAPFKSKLVKQELWAPRAIRTSDRKHPRESSNNIDSGVRGATWGINVVHMT